MAECEKMDFMANEESDGVGKGSGCLVYNLFRNIQAMGKDKPKSVEKLKSCLKKWERVVCVQDLFALLSSLIDEKNNYAVVQRKQSINIPVKTVSEQLCTCVKRKAQTSNSVVIVSSGDMEDADKVAIFENLKQSTSQLVKSPRKWSKTPNQSEIKCIIDGLTKSFYFQMNGGRKNPTKIAKEQTDVVIDTSISALQQFGYINIVEGNSEEIKYSFPSPFMMQCYRSLLKKFHPDNIHNWDGLSGFSSLLQQEVVECNYKLQTLKNSLNNVSDDHRLDILSAAADALHKVKDSRHISEGSIFRGYSRSLSRSSSLSSVEKMRKRSHSSSRSRERSRSLSSGKSQSSLDRRERRKRRCRSFSKERSRSPSRSKRRSRTTSRGSSKSRSLSRGRSRFLSRESRSSSRGRSNSRSLSRERQSKLHNLKRRKKNSCSSNSDNDSLLRQPTSKRLRQRSPDRDDKQTEYSLVCQTNLIQHVLDLKLLDPSTEDKLNKKHKREEFENLIQCMQTLTVDEILTIPEGIDLETMIFINALDKMKESKPKSVKALRNALLPVCNFVYVLNPNSVTDMSFQQTHQQKGRRRIQRKRKSIHVGEFIGQEFVKLTTNGILEASLSETLQVYISKLTQPKSSSEEIKQGTESGSKTNEENNSSDFRGQNKRQERDIIYSCLENHVKQRVLNLGTAMVLAECNDLKLFQDRYQEWVKKCGMESVDEDVEINEKVKKFCSRKEIYENLVKLCTITKVLNPKYLINLLESEKLVKVNSDGSVAYSCHFDKSQATNSSIKPEDATTLYQANLYKRAHSFFQEMRADFESLVTLT